MLFPTCQSFNQEASTIEASKGLSVAIVAEAVPYLHPPPISNYITSMHQADMNVSLRSQKDGSEVNKKAILKTP